MDQQLSEIDQKLETIIQILSKKQEQEIAKQELEIVTLRKLIEIRKEILKSSKYLIGTTGFIIIILIINPKHIFEPGLSSVILASISAIISTCLFILAMLNSTK